MHLSPAGDELSLPQPNPLRVPQQDVQARVQEHLLGHTFRTEVRFRVRTLPRLQDLGVGRKHHVVRRLDDKRLADGRQVQATPLLIHERLTRATYRSFTRSTFNEN